MVPTNDAGNQHANEGPAAEKTTKIAVIKGTQREKKNITFVSILKIVQRSN